MVIKEAGKSTRSAAMPAMTETNLKAALHAQMQSGSDMKLTSDEVEKLEKAFKEEEFRKLMADYVEEISDPKNRAETDAYIRQLETQGEVPEDKEIIRPSPHYCVKFLHLKRSSINAAKKSGEKPPDKEKLFINIVSSDSIKPPASETVREGDKTGKRWSIPHSLGPVRMEHDKSNRSVAALDCCFHPEAVQMSVSHAGFKDLLVETSRETAERGFKNAGDPVVIDQKYHILKGVTYKSGEVVTMIISKEKSKGAWKEGAAAEKKGKGAGKGGKKTEKEGKTVETAATATTGAGFKKGFMTATKTTKKKDSAKDGANAADSKNGGGGKRGGGTTPQGEDVPLYTVSESGNFDLSQHTMSEDLRGGIMASRPASIIYRIELPLVSSASELDLDVSDTKLKLASLPQAASNYSLDVALLYSCDGDRGKAKWDKKKVREANLLGMKYSESECVCFFLLLRGKFGWLICFCFLWSDASWLKSKTAVRSSKVKEATCTRAPKKNM